MPDWALYTLAILALIAALLALWWSLLRDRARGRARCNHCWYDLTTLAPSDPAAPAPTCPECGRRARTIRRLYRTRRRWGLAAVGFLLLLSAPVLALWPAVRRDGFWRTMPTTVVLFAESILGERAGSPVTVERHYRFTRGGHADWQWRALASRSSFLQFRRRWPDGMAPWVPVVDFSFLDATRHTVRIRTLGMSPPETFHPGSTLTHERLWTPDLGRLDPSATSLQVRLTIQDLDAHDPPTHTVDLVIPIERAGTIDDVLPPDRTPPDPAAPMVNPHPWLQRMVTSGRLAVQFMLPHPGSPWYSSSLSPPWVDTDVAVGLRLEVRHNGKTVAHARWALESRNQQTLAALLEGDAEAVAKADPADPAWKVIVRDDPEMAMLNTHARTRWVGSFEVPLRIFLNKPKE